MKLLEVYNKCAKLPFGKSIFSLAFCLKAPYFLTIKPAVEELRKGYAKISMQHRWSVQNHIKTVHAIAVCNLVEMCKYRYTIFIRHLVDFVYINA